MFIIKNFQNFLNLFLSLPRFAKIIIVLLNDASLCAISLWLAFYLRLDEFISMIGNTLLSALISVFILLTIFWLFGLYRTVFRYSGKYALTSITFAIGTYGLLFFFIITIYGISGVPRSIGIIQPLILFFVISASRLLVRFLFSINNVSKKEFVKRQRALIYGAGNAGRQIVSSLENNNRIKVIGFIDDDPLLQGQVIQGKNIFSSKNLPKLIKTEDITLILLAMPSINRRKRTSIIKNISKNKVIVRTLPSINDLVEGKISVSDIRDLDVSDILVRETNLPDKNFLKKDIENKVVMITGAGGSIGSELSRQILYLNPKKLVLVEISEYSLYKINQELSDIKKKQQMFSRIEILPLLASVVDKQRINKILQTYKPNILYHAAAYKHVTIVEENICEGVKNNILGTLITANAAISHKVANFVLISSDKAVRPTNIMGATKRVAELCLVALAKESNNVNTNLCAVRFGNVLGSSGSIIPKFKKQIIDGGPITLTHPDVTRFFMTIPEAAQLVINAGLMSEKGNIYLLDMGEPFKIKDLIYRMIQLSGLSVENEKNPDGDIKIEIIGLRPGEKLYEELLLSENPVKTKNKKIFIANDPFIKWTELKDYLLELEISLENENIFEILKLLEKLVSGFKSDRKISDYIFLGEKNKSEKRNDDNNKT